MQVELTIPECRMAAYVGLNRRLDAMALNRHEMYGRVHNGLYWETDIEAAAAELAFAKALRAFYAPAVSPRVDRAEGDVGGAQVRHTKRPNGSLIVHDRDIDHQEFFLVVGAMPSFRVVGSMLAREAKDKRFWRTDVPRPAFFVPQTALTPFNGG